MAKKKVLTNAASVGIIYRASDPSQVFLEIKDAGYPRKVFVGMGCLIGGNWVGEAAKGDGGPMDTFFREVEEELSFEKALADAVGLDQLHGVTDLRGLDTGRLITEVTSLPQDQDNLRWLIHAIKISVLPYGVYIVTVPEGVFRREEPNYSRGDSVGLISYYTVGLQEEVWTILERLQKKFGNLSNESVTVTIVTSLDEMIEAGFQVSWGHDQVLRRFFLDKGLKQARKMSMVSGITTSCLGVPANSYGTYTERFEFKLTPWTK